MRHWWAQEDRSAAIRAMLAKQMPLGAVDEELGAESAAEVLRPDSQQVMVGFSVCAQQLLQGCRRESPSTCMVSLVCFRLVLSYFHSRA